MAGGRPAAKLRRQADIIGLNGFICAVRTVKGLPCSTACIARAAQAS
jgi:hypothetical protein